MPISQAFARYNRAKTALLALLRAYKDANLGKPFNKLGKMLPASHMPPPKQCKATLLLWTGFPACYQILLRKSQ